MARGEFRDTDDFLKYKTRERSGGFLKWKKREPPKVSVWLHCRRKPIVIWQHPFQQIVSRENREGQTEVHVWSANLGCWESESVLKKQGLRDKKTDRRERPPERCPSCKLVEWVREQVKSGKLKLWTTIFRFEAADDDNVTEISAGGFAGMLKKEKLTEAEQSELKKHKVFLSEAWKETHVAKPNWLFCVVDNANPEAGVQKTWEPSGLGEKVQEVIAAKIESLGDEDGSIYENPYCLSWEHRPNEQEFSKKYRVIPLEKVKLTEEIRDLIESDPPTVDRDTAYLNGDSLRAQMETHWAATVVPPWDSIFSAKQPADEGDDFPPPPGGEDEDDRPKGKSDTKSKALPKEEPADVYVCEECGADFADPNQCEACGAEYDDEGTLTKHGRTYKAPPKMRAAKKTAAKRPADDEEPEETGDKVGFGGDED